MQQNRKQMASLVTAADVVRLVLHPHSTIGAKPQLVAQVVGALERRGDKPVPIDGVNVRVESCNEFSSARVDNSGAVHERVDSEVATKAEERIRLATGTQRRHRLYQLWCVMPIRSGAVRAAPRECLRDIRGGATNCATPTRDHRHAKLIRRRGR